MTDSTISPTDFSEENFDVQYECPHCGEILLTVKDKDLRAEMYFRCDKCGQSCRLITNQARRIPTKKDR